MVKKEQGGLDQKMMHDIFYACGTERVCVANKISKRVLEIPIRLPCPLDLKTIFLYQISQAK
jgi:hypothetical protein